MLNLGFFLLGVTATSLVTQQVPLLRDAGWTADETTRLQTTFGFGLLFARVAVGFVIDHIFAPRVLTTVSIGGAVACVLYAMYPDLGYVSAILIGFLLGAEFDVLAFLIKRYYGNVAYGRIYGVIFGVFYLGSAVGIWGLPKLREASADLSYDNALYAAAAILLASAVLMAFMPKYRYSRRPRRAARRRHARRPTGLIHSELSCDRLRSRLQLYSRPSSARSPAPARPRSRICGRSPTRCCKIRTRATGCRGAAL